MHRKKNDTLKLVEEEQFRGRNWERNAIVILSNSER